MKPVPPGRPRDRSLLAVAPLMPAALGVVAGIAARSIPRRLAVPGPGASGRSSALRSPSSRDGPGGGRVSGSSWRSPASAAAWHHGRWSDLAADDLARGFKTGDEPRPCWLRGVVVEAPVYRADADRLGGQGTTRTVVAVTGASDGRDWSRASGRVAVWIGGDRSDLEPGRPVELAGNLAADRRSAQPRRARRPRVVAGRGRPAPGLGRLADGRMGRSTREDMALDLSARPGPRLGVSEARRGARPVGRAAGLGPGARASRGGRPGAQRRLREDRDDAPARDLGPAPPGARRPWSGWPAASRASATGRPWSR